MVIVLLYFKQYNNDICFEITLHPGARAAVLILVSHHYAMFDKQKKVKYVYGWRLDASWWIFIVFIPFTQNPGLFYVAHSINNISAIYSHKWFAIESHL